MSSYKERDKQMIREFLEMRSGGMKACIAQDKLAEKNFLSPERVHKIIYTKKDLKSEVVSEL